jgi:hypothetical protein
VAAKDVASVYGSKVDVTWPNVSMMIVKRDGNGMDWRYVGRLKPLCVRFKSADGKSFASWGNASHWEVRLETYVPALLPCLEGVRGRSN